MGYTQEQAFPPGKDDAVEKLTEREREILLLIFDGKSSSETAKIIGVSKRTVDFHLARVYEKLNVNNRVQAFKKAIELGLLDT